MLATFYTTVTKRFAPQNARVFHGWPSRVKSPLARLIFPPNNALKICAQNRCKFSRSVSSFTLPSGERVLYGIIGANLAVFGLWNAAESDAFYQHSWRARKYMHDNFTMSAQGVVNQLKLHTMITSTFSHRELGHLLMNMVTLFFFGREAIMILGTKSFLKLYVYGGLTSSACHLGWSMVGPYAGVPGSLMISPYQKSLGASGAVNATVLWSCLMFPARTVYIYMILPVPAAVLGIIFVGKDLWGLYEGGGNVANAAHLGGAAFGTMFYFATRRRFF